MQVKSCPCNGCEAPKRHKYCHATCPEYAEWNTEHLRDLELVREAKNINHICFPPRLRKPKKGRKR